MLEVLKNNWKRVLEEKAYVMVGLILTIISVFGAILLTNKTEIKGNVAVITKEANIPFESCKYYNITLLSKEPPTSELIQSRYDAVVILEGRHYTINTVKNEVFEEELDRALKNPQTFIPNTDYTRQIGTNILGYMMMFVLIQGMAYARCFAEDKEKQMIKRVVISPIGFSKYLLGHASFIFMMIFIPTFGVIIGAKIIGIPIGFSLLQYAGLIGIITLLATSFALFLNSLFCVADTANMLGSSIIVLSSILAGSFYSFTNNESLFNKILHIIPQKDFINYANALEKGRLTMALECQLIYVILLCLVFFTFAVIKTRRDYIHY